jgi:hypothetical protein
LGREWHPGECFGRSSGFYTPAVDSEYVGVEHWGLGSGAVHSGWCCGLRLLVWSAVSVVKHCGRKRAIFSACARLVELVPVALVGFGSEGLALGEGVTVPCKNVCGMARSRSPLAGNVGLALGALGVQETRPERGDRAVLTSSGSWGSVGSWSGGSGALIGEAGRSGVLPTPLARPGARRPTLVTRGREGEVGLGCLC